MTRHLDLLRTLPAPPRRPPAIGAGAAVALLAVVALGTAAAVGWSAHRSQQLHERLRLLEAPSGGPPAAARLDPVVVDALARQLAQRQALLAAFTGQPGDGAADPARPSAWLSALATLGGGGVSLDTVRLEPGARLAVGGTAASAADVNAWLARFQQHPLTGRSAVGQLEIRSAEPGGTLLSFRLSPPADDAGAGGATPAPPATPARPSPAETAAVALDTVVAEGARR